MDEKSSQSQPLPESTETTDPSVELLPIVRIGVETELSKYPIHNLAKRGRVDIQIIKRTPEGQIDLRWEVSYSERYGQARQFAYKLDTLIINRRIDEHERSLPEVIRLGSLRDLAEELGLDGSGDSTNRVKKALHQNAGAYITAKIKYKTNDGGHRLLEAGFTRYSVIFTGEQLPDGREADAVYLVLNKPFREVLNNAPIRPLNYEYLKALKPAPQRFYEIISSRIYAAQKNRNPYARILYSEFCTYSALTRHFDYENFRVQMAKIHKDHLTSGYITKVYYEETTDAEGKLDWMMCYQPGGRARAEYMTFARKRLQLEAKYEAVEDIESEGESEQGSGLSVVAPVSKPRKPVLPKDPLLIELMNRGIAESKGRKILSSLAEGQQVLDQLEWGDHLIASEPAKFRSPAGFYVYLLSENVAPPANFETSRQRKAREEAQEKAEAEHLRLMRLEDEYEDYRSQQVEDFIRVQVPQSELAEITAKKRQHLQQSYRGFRFLPPETTKVMVWGAVKAEIRPRVKFLSFEEFAQQKASQPSLFTAAEAVGQPVRQSVGQGGGSEAAVETPTLGPRVEVKTTGVEAREEEPAIEPKSRQAVETQKMAASAAEAPRGEEIPPPAKESAYRADLSVLEGTLKSQSETRPAQTGENESLGADEATLFERYQEFQRKEARRVLDRLEILERGRRMKAARAYLLGEHPKKDDYQRLIAEGEYEEFHKLSEEHLLKVTLEDLRLPNFEDWKRYALSAISGK